MNGIVSGISYIAEKVFAESIAVEFGRVDVVRLGGIGSKGSVSDINRLIETDVFLAVKGESVYGGFEVISRDMVRFRFGGWIIHKDLAF